MSVKIDVARLMYEMGRRGLTQAEFARVVGITETTISRAKRGRVRMATLRTIAIGLMRIPPLPGADLMLIQPDEQQSGVPEADEKAV